MNNWHTEFMAEYDRQHILEVAEESRLGSQASPFRVYRPGIFERTIVLLANWMISTGRQLRERYEVRAVPCNNCPTGSYAP